MRRIPAQLECLSAKEKVKIRKLTDRREALEQQLSDADDAANESFYERMNEITEAINAIERSRKQVYPDDMKARCGVVVSINASGEPAYTYGLLRKEDEKELAKISSDEGQGSNPTCATASEAATEDDANTYSAGLVESLTMHKTFSVANPSTTERPNPLRKSGFLLRILHVFAFHLSS